VRHPTEYRRRCALSGALLFGSMSIAVPFPARAEVKVAGTPAAARLVADHDGIADAFAAMAAAFNVRYRTSAPLDGVISGTYAGSLNEVIARVLAGYSYVVRHVDEATEIVIVGRHGAQAAAPQPSLAPMKTFASQWR
jgi:hypothetical protein